MSLELLNQMATVIELIDAASRAGRLIRVASQMDPNIDVRPARKSLRNLVANIGERLGDIHHAERHRSITKKLGRAPIYKRLNGYVTPCDPKTGVPCCFAPNDIDYTDET